jgi:hypothetical protein
VKGLEERFLVRLGIELEKLVMHVLQDRLVAHRKVVERRVFDREIALAHGAADACDGVARRAPQARLSFRCLDLLLDRPVEPAVEEHRVVVATGAPF